MFCKVKKIAITLLILQQTLQIHSQTIPSFIYRNPNVEDESPSIIEKLMKQEFSWSHVSVILNTIILVFLIFITYSLYKSKNQKSTKIMLEITSGGSCVTVPILSLSLCPSYYNFPVPKVHDLSISAFSQSKLFVSWSSFIVTNRVTGQTVKIPSIIDINIITRYKISQIINQPFNVYVLITHQGFASTLNPSCLPQSNDHVDDVHVKVDETTSMYPKLD